MEKKINKKRKIIKFVFGFFALIILIAAIITFSLYDFSNPDDLSLFLERKFSKMGVAGLAVTMVDEKGITYFKGFGYADVENKKEITQDTIFRIASISKTITGTAIMQLSEKGQLDIDKDINSYLHIKIINPNYPNAKITTRMLLTHTSSICDNYTVYDSLYTYSSGGGDSPVSLEEFIKGYFLEEGKWYYAYENYYESEPGMLREYSNCGYALLGYLLEEITNQDFNEYCKENIFEPLEMYDTYWFLSEIDTSKMAKLYNKVGEAYPFYGFPTYPDGALRTSSADYGKFLTTMINYGDCNDGYILKKETIDEILRPQIPELMQDQGLTWLLKGPEEFKVDCGEALVPGHSGGDEGACTISFYCPDTKTGAIIFINNDIKTSQILTLFQIIKRMAKEVISG
jgi:CubicO group peptidase (beta-lactamase class C family)